jgi:guanidinobutyrase
VSTYADADIVIRGAPLDGETNYRSGTRFGPSARRRGEGTTTTSTRESP